MPCIRVLMRMAILVTLAAAGLWIVQRVVLNTFVGTKPIGVDPGPAPATFERAFPNLILERPVYLTFPPDGSNRIAVISQYGSMLMFPNDPLVEEASEVLNIRDKVAYKDSSNEEGLLGLAF